MVYVVGGKDIHLQCHHYILDPGHQLFWLEQPKKDVSKMVTSCVNRGGEATFQVFPPVLSSHDPTVDNSYTSKVGSGDVTPPPTEAGGECLPIL
jgi:hypothetical protein